MIEDGFCVKQEWSDEVADFADVRRVRVVVDKKRGHLVEDDSVLSAAAEEKGRGGSSVEPPIPVTEPSAAAPSAGQGDGAEEGNAPPQGVELFASAPSPSALTHEQRVDIARAIKDAKQRHPFFAGDTANLWEEELNEDFWNRYANEFGYTYPSLRNVMRVCKAIPPNQRHPEMSFAHHGALQSQDIETREAWLERAFEEEWPVKRLREELVEEGLLTAKPRVKRWTLEELRELEGDLCADPYEFQGKDEDPGDVARALDFFFDWLGEQ